MPTAHRRTASQTRLPRILGILIVVSCILSALIGVRHFFTVGTIVCTLDEQNCPVELTTALEVLLTQPLIATDYTGSIYEKALPLPVTLQTVEKRLPGTLHLRFVTEPIAYQLNTPDGIFAVSSTGFPFKQTGTATEITITLTESLNSLLSSPTTVTPSTHNTLTALAKTLTRHNLTPELITWVDKDTITLIMDDGTPTVLLDAHNPVTAIQKLQLILSAPEYLAVAPQVHEIDVRFNLPVLRMKQ